MTLKTHLVNSAMLIHRLLYSLINKTRLFTLCCRKHVKHWFVSFTTHLPPFLQRHQAPQTFWPGAIFRSGTWSSHGPGRNISRSLISDSFGTKSSHRHAFLPSFGSNGVPFPLLSKYHHCGKSDSLTLFDKLSRSFKVIQFLITWYGICFFKSRTKHWPYLVDQQIKLLHQHPASKKSITTNGWNLLPVVSREMFATMVQCLKIHTASLS